MKEIDSETWGFDQSQAAECFYKLAQRYYQRNFGSSKKEDIDLLMFGFFDEVNKGLTDYAIGLQLGLDVSAVQRKRSRHLLTLGDREAGSWARDLARAIESGEYSNDGKKITIEFPSKTICDEFRDYLQKNKVYSDTRFGSNRVTMSGKVFCDVVAIKVAEDYSEQIGDSNLKGSLKKEEIIKAIAGILSRGCGEAAEGLVEDNISNIFCTIEEAMDSVKGTSQALITAVGTFARGLREPKTAT